MSSYGLKYDNNIAFILRYKYVQQYCYEPENVIDIYRVLKEFLKYPVIKYLSVPTQKIILRQCNSEDDFYTLDVGNSQYNVIDFRLINDVKNKIYQFCKDNNALFDFISLTQALYDIYNKCFRELLPNNHKFQLDRYITKHDLLKSILFRHWCGSENVLDMMSMYAFEKATNPLLLNYPPKLITSTMNSDTYQENYRLDTRIYKTTNGRIGTYTASNELLFIKRYIMAITNPKLIDYNFVLNPLSIDMIAVPYYRPSD